MTGVACGCAIGLGVARVVRDAIVSIAAGIAARIATLDTACTIICIGAVNLVLLGQRLSRFEEAHVGDIDTLDDVVV